MRALTVRPGTKDSLSCGPRGSRTPGGCGAGRGHRDRVVRHRCRRLVPAQVRGLGWVGGRRGPRLHPSAAALLLGAGPATAATRSVVSGSALPVATAHSAAAISRSARLRGIRRDRTDRAAVRILRLVHRCEPGARRVPPPVVSVAVCPIVTRGCSCRSPSRRPVGSGAVVPGVALGYCEPVLPEVLPEAAPGPFAVPRCAFSATESVACSMAWAIGTPASSS